MAIKLPRKLFIGKFKGAPGNDINFRIPSRTSTQGYFTFRYYPQARLSAQTQIDKLHASQIRHFEQHLGVTHLNGRIVVTFILSIAKTSKKASIRRRLMHRLSEAFRTALVRVGPNVLPQTPMHLVFSPSMRILEAPFQDLSTDVIQSYLSAKKQFESLSKTKQNSMMGRGHSGSTQSSIHSSGPTHYNTLASLEANIRTHTSGLQNSLYLKSHGGVTVLLNRMKHVANSHMRSTVQTDVKRI